MYRFLLNSLEEARFTSCPECHQRTLLRKIPLVVHVDPRNPVVLNKQCRYCPDCDLLIVHQDELEPLLVLSLQKQFSEVIGNDYLVLGTLDKSTWRRRDKELIDMERLPEKLHDFKEYLSLDYTPAGWYPADQTPARRPAPPLSKPTGWQRQEDAQTPPALSIDDPQQVADLMEKMESHLPIPSELTRAAANFLRARGDFVPPHRQIYISAVFYHGDEGGIMCAISPKESQEVVVISLTHLKISYRHPLEKAIRAYQKARRRKLGRST